MAVLRAAIVLYAALPLWVCGDDAVVVVSDLTSTGSVGAMAITATHPLLAYVVLSNAGTAAADCDHIAFSIQLGDFRTDGWSSGLNGVVGTDGDETTLFVGHSITWASLRVVATASNCSLTPTVKGIFYTLGTTPTTLTSSDVAVGEFFLHNAISAPETPYVKSVTFRVTDSHDCEDVDLSLTVLVNKNYLDNYYQKVVPATFEHKGDSQVLEWGQLLQPDNGLPPSMSFSAVPTEGTLPAGCVMIYAVDVECYAAGIPTTIAPSTPVLTTDAPLTEGPVLPTAVPTAAPPATSSPHTPPPSVSTPLPSSATLPPTTPPATQTPQAGTGVLTQCVVGQLLAAHPVGTEYFFDQSYLHEVTAQTQILSLHSIVISRAAGPGGAAVFVVTVFSDDHGMSLVTVLQTSVHLNPGENVTVTPDADSVGLGGSILTAQFSTAAGADTTFDATLHLYTQFTPKAGEGPVDGSALVVQKDALGFAPELPMSGENYQESGSQQTAMIVCERESSVAFTALPGQGWLKVLGANAVAYLAQDTSQNAVFEVQCLPNSALWVSFSGRARFLWKGTQTATPTQVIPKDKRRQETRVPPVSGLTPPPPSPPHSGEVVLSEIVVGVVNFNVADIHNTIPVDLLTPFQLTSDAYPSTHTPYLQRFELTRTADGAADTAEFTLTLHSDVDETVLWWGAVTLARNATASFSLGTPYASGMYFRANPTSAITAHMGFRYEMRVHSVFVPNTLNTTHDPPTLSEAKAFTATDASLFASGEHTSLTYGTTFSGLLHCWHNGVVNITVALGSVQAITPHLTVYAAHDVLQPTPLLLRCTQGAAIVIIGTSPCTFSWESQADDTPSPHGSSDGTAVAVSVSLSAVLIVVGVFFLQRWWRRRSREQHKALMGSEGDDAEVLGLGEMDDVAPFL